MNPRALSTVSSSIPKLSCFTLAGPLAEVVSTPQFLPGEGGAFPWFISLHRELFGIFRCCSRVFSAVIIMEQKCVQNTSGTTWCILEHQNQVLGLKSGFSPRVMRWEGATCFALKLLCILDDSPVQGQTEFLVFSKNNALCKRRNQVEELGDQTSWSRRWDRLQQFLC